MNTPTMNPVFAIAPGAGDLPKKDVSHYVDQPPRSDGRLSKLIITHRNETVSP